MGQALITPDTFRSITEQSLRVLWTSAAAPPGRLVLAVLCGICGLAAGLAAWYELNATGIALISAAYLCGGLRPVLNGAVELRRGRLDINFLMVLVAVVALALGHWGDGLILLFLFTLSDALESYAVERTRRSVSALLDLRPETACVVRDGREFETRVEQLQPGDEIRVRPGERLPIDGEILTGSGAVDESIVTGESVPVDKQPGATVFAGTINVTGSLLVRMTHPATESTLARIVHLVEQAQEQKARSQRLVERWEAPYVLGVLLLSLAAFLVGWVRTHDFSGSLYQAMVLLIAASPCAVVLASPVAVLAAVTRGARHGVLFKGGSHLERLAAVGTIALDKTGTLTRGRPVVTALEPLPGTAPEELLALAATLESHSQHPLAQAITAAAAARGITPEEVHDFFSEAGFGLSGKVAGRWVGVGRPELFARRAVELPPELTDPSHEHDGLTRVYVYRDDGRGGSIALADEIRAEAASTLRLLRELGISRFILLTGDQNAPAQRVAAALGITEVRARLRPEDKLAQIHTLSKTTDGVAMVGDGVNDAPALAAATVGVAMGAAGSDVALENADVVLMRDNLHGLAEAVHLARHCRATIRLSLMIAFGMIFLLVLLTLTGIMWLPVAVIGHEGSTVLVVLNGLRLLRQDNVVEHVTAQSEGISHWPQTA